MQFHKVNSHPKRTSYDGADNWIFGYSSRKSPSFLQLNKAMCDNFQTIFGDLREFLDPRGKKYACSVCTRNLETDEIVDGIYIPDLPDIGNAPNHLSRVIRSKETSHSIHVILVTRDPPQIVHIRKGSRFWTYIPEIDNTQSCKSFVLIGHDLSYNPPRDAIDRPYFE